MPGTSPSPAPVRSAQYNAKLVPLNYSAFLTASKPSMQFKIGRYLSREAAIRNLILGVLTAVSTPSYKIGNYMAAGLEMWKKANKFGGSVAGRAEIGYVISTWTARGLAAVTLGHIRDTITGVPVP